MDKKTFATQIAYLSAAYDREVSTPLAAVYWEQLGNLPGAPFVEAVKTHVNIKQYWPTVAELRQATQAAIRRRGPTALPAPEVSTVDVLRGHAVILGVDPEKYVRDMIKAGASVVKPNFNAVSKRVADIGKSR